VTLSFTNAVLFVGFFTCLEFSRISSVHTSLINLIGGQLYRDRRDRATSILRVHVNEKKDSGAQHGQTLLVFKKDPQIYSSHCNSDLFVYILRLLLCFFKMYHAFIIKFEVTHCSLLAPPPLFIPL